MKKPVRKTKEEIEALVDKRADRKIRELKQIPTGDMQKFLTALSDFAKKWGIKQSEVRFSSTWSGAYFVANRPETREEKFKRIKKEEDWKYTQKKWEWDREQQRLKREEDERAVEVARAKRLLEQQTANTSQCCPSNCCCRRK